MQAVCDGHCRFIYANTAAPGSMHDSAAWCQLLQLAGAKSSNYVPDGTCTRLSVLRIAGYGTAVLL